MTISTIKKNWSYAALTHIVNPNHFNDKKALCAKEFVAKVEVNINSINKSIEKAHEVLKILAREFKQQPTTLRKLYTKFTTKRLEQALKQREFVLIHDKSIPRSLWKTAIIIKLIINSDFIVQTELVHLLTSYETQRSISQL